MIYQNKKDNILYEYPYTIHYLKELYNVFVSVEFIEFKNHINGIFISEETFKNYFTPSKLISKLHKI